MLNSAADTVSLVEIMLMLQPQSELRPEQFLKAGLLPTHHISGGTHMVLCVSTSKYNNVADHFVQD